MEYSKRLTITDDSDLQLPIELWERHFVESGTSKTAVVQPVGIAIGVWIWSPRDLVEIRLPVHHWIAEKPFRRSLGGRRIDVAKWDEPGLFVTSRDDDEDIRSIRGTMRVHSPEWVPTKPD